MIIRFVLAFIGMGLIVTGTTIICNGVHYGFFMMLVGGGCVGSLIPK